MPKLDKAAYHANDHISIAFEPKETSCFGRLKISMRDREDHYNEPVLYTTKVRRVEDAWLEIDSVFNEKTTWHDIITILMKLDVAFHSYCAMD